MSLFTTAPTALYTIDQLFAGFDPTQVETFAATPDFQIYREFVADGGSASTNKPKVLERASHDCSILQLLADALLGHNVVAIMGGHAVSRNTQAYRDTAKTAALLTEAGYLVLTGGGPGAMEAAHLGAAVGKVGADLDNALAHLAKGPPDSSKQPVKYTGDPTNPTTIDNAILKELGEYYKWGWEVRQDYPAGGGVAIPTWMYGWEPTTVFASAIGKYFQNSIREDGLLAAASHGIVYAEGRAGTLQEVFQDAAQNYYRSFPAPAEAGKGVFSPMVFLGDFWTLENAPGRKTLPVKPLLDKLWAASSSLTKEERARVVYVATPEAAADAIKAFDAPAASPALMIAKATAKS